ncbi:MAG: 2-polyprenyl-3-methyl-6-methoxy-1,4-benzoquinone monooxygenase [Pseudomonadales bacterium]|nr:2-polyprenyl-3-methyl-6-methoxy-1,4-benzoquinone monooxygenase [Pseudomonadales bacterium]
MNPVDRLIARFDEALRTVAGTVGTSDRASPAIGIEGRELNAQEKETAARLMRVNHCGEVCAQALYRGQALTAKSGRVAGSLNQAAREETDHLAWCEARIQELGSHVSYLNPVWYAASFAMGATAGLMGDRVNLGFVAATESEVCRHLDDHLERLPEGDDRSRSILSKMRDDEARHESNALEAGGARFPAPVKAVMRGVSKLMTRSTYWI